MANLRSRIINHLTEKGNFDPQVDEDMIDDLIDNCMLAKTLFKRIMTEGAVLEYTTTSGSRMIKMSPALNAYQMVMRNVYQLSSKLGINRNDRMKLKIIEKKQQDELDRITG